MKNGLVSVPSENGPPRDISKGRAKTQKGKQGLNMQLKQCGEWWGVLANSYLGVRDKGSEKRQGLSDIMGKDVQAVGKTLAPQIGVRSQGTRGMETIL